MGWMEVVPETLPIPNGYETYSLLLLPDYDWLRSVEDPALLLDKFSRFGDIIGKQHLACWFYTSGRLGSGHELGVDLHLYAVLPAKVSTENELKKVLAKKRVKQRGKLPVGVDVKRCRLICAMLGLPYSNSPYIAFFDQYPTLPELMVDHHASLRDPYYVSHDAITRPKVVLSMGSLSINGFIELMDTLEQQILREDIRSDSIRWQRFLIALKQWCDSNRKGIVRLVEKFATISAREALKKL
jgi:hypothetical protein